MHLKYLHYFGSESNESLLEAYELATKGQQTDQLRPKDSQIARKEISQIPSLVLNAGWY
jgi:hypothetical protein